jgi:hypothetical protein
MLNRVLSNSPYLALNNAYPDKFKPWELKVSPHGFWNESNSILAIKWLIEEKLKWNDTQMKKMLSKRIFYEYGLGGMLMDIYNCSPFEAINSAYPEKFKKWEISGKVPVSHWDKRENILEAIDWLIEKKFNWTKEDIINNSNFAVQ